MLFNFCSGVGHRVSQKFINVTTFTLVTNNNYRLATGAFVIAMFIIMCCCFFYCYKKNGCKYTGSSFGGFNGGGPIGGGQGGGGPCGGSGGSCHWTSQTFAVDVIITYSTCKATYTATVDITV